MGVEYAISMKRLIPAIVAVTIFLVMPLLPARADGDITPPPRVRYSVSPETVRVVLDLPSETTYTDLFTPSAVQVAVATPLAQALPALAVTDPVVTSIAVTADAGGQALLTVSLAKPRKCRVFTLPAAGDKPFRVVVDVLKRFEQEDQRALSPAITYTRIEQQSDDRYMVAHLVEIDTRQESVHFAVTPAAGERETVASMTARTHAVCGVNGGYFLDGTRPVGLLKSDGAVITVPLWKRTAAAFPRSGPPVFDNPTGAWKVTLPDGTTRVFPDWVDDLPVKSPARVIPGASVLNAPANPNGLTVIIHDGKILARTTAATPLARGDYALFLTGAEAQALDAQLSVDAAVQVEAQLTPVWSDYPNAVGAGPRLLKDGQLCITCDEESIPPDIRTGRHARTGLGVGADGLVLLAVVEAPGPYGGGATLEELAELLKAHGALDAMNLDGGGSSSLGIDGVTVNYPPKSWVRPVACGVLVYDDGVAPRNIWDQLNQWEQ